MAKNKIKDDVLKAISKIDADKPKSIRDVQRELKYSYPTVLKYVTVLVAEDKIITQKIGQAILLKIK